MLFPGPVNCFKVFQGNILTKNSEYHQPAFGLAGWTGSEENEIEKSLDLAVDSGCNFFYSAWAYGSGKSEKILGRLIKRHAGKKLYTATKIPPRNFK